MRLSYTDVEQLSRAPSPVTRAEVAAKIAENFAKGRFGGREKDIAVEIFRLLARDAEVQVRATLSQRLKTCSELPHDIALQLAQDIEQVSVPLLEFSNILNDDDLVAIVESSHEVAKLTAIARRKLVQPSVADALLRTRNPIVATTVIRNPGAYMEEHSLLQAIEAMSAQESVIEALMERGGLPVVCVEKIFMSVSDALKKRLAGQYHMSRHLIEGQLEYVQEMHTLGMAERSGAVDVAALVRHLHSQHKLTSSIVIRALCVGDLRFFEQAMSLWTGVPVENVRNLMLDAGEDGFKSLYRLSPLPPTYFEAVRTLLNLVLELSRNGREIPADFSRRVVDSIMEKGYDLTIEYMPLLLAIIKGNAREFSSVH